MLPQRIQTWVREVSLKTVTIALLFLISLGAFGIIAHEIVTEKEDDFDMLVFSFLKDYSGHGTIHFLRTVTFFGSSLFLFPAYVLLVGGLLLARLKTRALNVTIIGLTSTALLHLLKGIFERSRPELPLFQSLNNYSFPSGHALSSFIFCSMLIWLIWESRWNKVVKWVLAVLLFLFSMLIGISRIVLRYHYASDVIAGFCLGFVWVLLSFWLFEKLKMGVLRKKEQRKYRSNL